jgi:uncharacterized protein (DUF58 family)
VIIPTRRAIILIGAAAPAALLIGVIAPGWWHVAPLWIAAVSGAILFDALIAPDPARATFALDMPASVGVGSDFTATLRLSDGQGGVRRDPTAAVSVDRRLADSGRADAVMLPAGGGAEVHFHLSALRRGPAWLGTVWVRWTGRLGLAMRQARRVFDQAITVAPSIRAVEEDAARLFQRDAQVGQRLNARLGEGSEFESLVRFMPGLDRRAIDWKQSARHTDLLAKQFETERDSRIVLAIDAGRMMSDPMPGGGAEALSRLDRSVDAALALGYVALKLEDRVSLFAFAGKPTVISREFTRSGDFVGLRRAAADIGYGVEETNYTLALATLGARLKRRALIVMFTEFADAASAELMLAAASRLVTKHLVMFVVLADAELEAMTNTVPDTAEGLASATIAADLLRDRQVVLSRLRRMGAIVIEAPAGGVSMPLLDAYVRVKRRGAL